MCTMLVQCSMSTHFLLTLTYLPLPVDELGAELGIMHVFGSFQC